MILYNTEHGNIFEMLIKGDEENPEVYFNYETGPIRAMDNEKEIIVYVVDMIESGEVVVLDEENIELIDGGFFI